MIHSSVYRSFVHHSDDGSPIQRLSGIKILRLALFVSLGTLFAPYAMGQTSPSLGFQKRHGDEIMVCGQLYRIGTPVKLWLDPGGFDAYRTDRRFAAFDQRKWKSTVEAMKAGKIEWVSNSQELSPDRFGLRYEPQAASQYTPEQLELVRGGGWELPLLQDKIDQFVLHFDVCGTSAQCFFVLHDIRGLSVHFLLDADGTIYQTLDLKERAWHATKSNDRSIGIEIANIGAYRADDRELPFARWYRPDEQGKVFLIFPDKVKGAELLKGKALSPRRNDLIQGSLHDVVYQQYDFTPQQYDALAKLTAALCNIFPKMKPDAPRTPEGYVIDRTLSDEQWASFGGILGHYHVQANKTDPGPAMDWEYLLKQVHIHQAKIDAAQPTP